MNLQVRIRRLGFLITAVALAAGNIEANAADDPSKKDEAKSEEKSPEARLTWNNGESLPGELVGATGKELTWSSPLFAKPVPLSLSALRSVTRDAKAIRPDGSMALNLRDGSRIYGDLTGVEEEWLNVKSERHGVVRIRKGEVESVHRLEGGDVLWCGPFGEAGWKYLNTDVSAGSRLQSAEGGALHSVAWRQQVTLPLELPDQVEIEFRLSSSVQPEFELKAIAEKQTIILTTWKDELVLRSGSHFLSIGSLESADRAVNLRLFWDRKAGSGMVATPEGKVLGRWKSAKDGVGAKEWSENGIEGVASAVFPAPLPPAKPPASGRSSSKSKSQPVAGVSLANRGPEIKLEFLRVRNWEGDRPEGTASDPFRTRLEKKEGPPIEGRIVSGNADSLVFRMEKGGTEQTIPIEEVESIFFPLEPVQEADTKKKPDEFRFADGTWLRGRLLGIEDGSVRIESALTEEPLMARLDGLRELRIHSAAVAAADEKDEPLPLAKQDKLLTGETTIHGTWHPAGSKRIHWRLAGAAEPVEIASTAEMELTRVPSGDGDWPRSPALFHLSNGQIAPGELVAINGGKESSVEYRSDIFDSGTFMPDDLNAIQFRGPEVNPDGFADPGWHIVRGEEKAVTLKDGTLTLDPGGSWGHPSILVGDEVRFTIQPSGYGTLRVRMFTEGTAAGSPSTNILLAHYGNEIYCGLEETPGQLNQRRDISVGSDKVAKIRLSWDNAGTRIFVNESMAIRIPNDKKKAKRSGLGLIFEPANLWGNGERQMKITDFSLRTAPGVTWVPGVNPVAKERALFLPRFRKEDPPLHMLLAPNGDVLRGTIVAAAGERIGFRSGLEELSIPRDRVAAAIWLKPPEGGQEETGEDKEKEPATEPEVKKPEGPEPTHWLLLTSGARIGLAIESFGPEFVTGHSQTLGRCRIPADHVHLIRSTRPETSPASQAFANWQLKKAPEPLAKAGGGVNSPMIGKDAPEIDLAMLDGGQFRLTEEKDKIVVLDFWATWCVPCVRAIPDMIREFSQFDRDRVRFIGVNQAEAPDQIKTFIEQRGWSPFEVALDVETAAGSAFGVEGIPHTVIVDHEGKVAWVSTGFKPDGAREAAEVVRGLLGDAPADRTSRVMNAEDIRDIGVEPARFDEYLATFLADLVSTDREKAFKVFARAVEVVETSREREVWKLKPNDSSKTFMFEAIARLRDHSEPVSWIAFQADLMRSEAIPPFEFQRIWTVRRVIDGFVGAGEDTLTPTRPIEDSMKILAEAIGNREFYPLAAPLMVRILQRYDIDTVNALQIALNSADDAEFNPFLEELRVALDVHLRGREGYRDRKYSEAAADHYVAVLSDDAVPLTVRVALADFLNSDASFDQNRDLTLAGAEVIADAWKGDTPVFQFWSFKILEAFMREERDEAWKSVAARLGKGFRARYLSETPPPGTSNVPDDDLVALMMDVYLSCGEAESAKTAYEQFQKRFVDFELPMIHLIRAGDIEAAADLFSEQSNRIGRKEIRTAVFDDRLEKNAPAFLELIERPELRLLAETVIASAHDPLPPGTRSPPLADRPGSPRSLRLQAAAKKFEDTVFAREPMKRRVLGFLATDVASAILVGDVIREEADEIDVDAAMEGRVFSKATKDWIITSPNLAVVEGALLAAMAAGDIKKADTLLDWVAGADPETSEQKTDFAHRIINLPARAILGSADLKKTAGTLIPICQRLALGIEGLEAAEGNLKIPRFAWSQLTFALGEAGKMNEFVSWVRTTGDKDDAEKKFGIWRAGVGDYFRLLAEKSRGAPVEERVDFLNAMLGQDWVGSGYNPWTNGGFRNPGSCDYLTVEELLEQGEAMAKASPRNGHAWNDLAYVFAGADRFDEALEYWDRAVEEREAAGVVNDANRYRTNKARALLQWKRTDEAREIIDSINPDEFSEPEFKIIRERLVSGKPLVPPITKLTAMTAEIRPAPYIPAVITKTEGEADPETENATVENEAATEEGDPSGPND